jgi:hypothetical protein
VRPEFKPQYHQKTKREKTGHTGHRGKRPSFGVRSQVTFPADSSLALLCLPGPQGNGGEICALQAIVRTPQVLPFANFNKRKWWLLLSLLLSLSRGEKPFSKGKSYTLLCNEIPLERVGVVECFLASMKP